MAEIPFYTLPFIFTWFSSGLKTDNSIFVSDFSFYLLFFLTVIDKRFGLWFACQIYCESFLLCDLPLGLSADCRVFVSMWRAEMSLVLFYCHPLAMKVDSSYSVIELLWIGGLYLYDERFPYEGWLFGAAEQMWIKTLKTQRMRCTAIKTVIKNCSQKRNMHTLTCFLMQKNPPTALSTWISHGYKRYLRVHVSMIV